MDNDGEFYFDYERLLTENRLLHQSGYYLGASNGWVRLFTLPARRYWVAQAACEHLTADWKIHFSIRPQDIPLAFNLLAELYYKMKLPAGLKAPYPDSRKDDSNHWPKHMRGREITVYILLFERTTRTKQTMFYSRQNLAEAKQTIDWPIASTEDVYSACDLTVDDEVPLDRYLDFAVRAEQLLAKHHVQSRGCATGDYPLGWFCSLRNEKFIATEADENNNDGSNPLKLNYPPNECGYNGSNDPRDLAREIGDLATYSGRKRQARTQSMLVVIIGLLVVFVAAAWYW